MTSIK
jgi:hypothetical protein